MTELDEFDRRILAAVQENGRISGAELAITVALSGSQCSRRQKKLEDDGVIARYAAILDDAAIGLDVTAFVTVSLERHGETEAAAFAHAIERRDDVLECWSVSGDDDYMLRVVAPNLQAFSNMLMQELLAIHNVANVRSIIALDCLKRTTKLPL